MSSTEDILLSILTRYTDTEAIEQQEKQAILSSTSSMAFCENNDTGVRSSSSSWDYNFQPTTAGTGTNMFVQDCGSPPSTLSPSSSIGGVEEVTSIFDNIMIDSQKTIHLLPLPPTIGTNVHTFQQQTLQQQQMMNGCFNMANGNGMLTQFSPGNTSPTIMTSQSPSSSTTSMDSDSPYLKNNHKGVKKSNKTTKSTTFSTTMTTSSVSQSSSSPNGVQFVNHSSEEIEYKCRNAATSTNGEKRKRGRPKKEIPVSKNITFVQDGYNKGFKK